MMLADLNPWLYVGTSAEGRRVVVSTVGEADGVVFNCPSSTCKHAIDIGFGGRRADGHARPDRHGWAASGESAQSLTLEPNVVLTCCQFAVKNGELT
jgi:hypothetical protein